MTSLPSQPSNPTGPLDGMRILDLRNFGFNEELFPGQEIVDE